MTQQEYIALVDRCKQLSYEYYVLTQPTVSDAQFDALVAEIEQTEIEHPEWTLADSPTQMVGSDVDVKSGRRLIRHRTRMLSCQKAQTQEAVTKWMQTTEKKLKRKDGLHYALEWKLDGISCSLVYQDGVLVSAASRGKHGVMGQDLLDHVRLMASVPQKIYMDGRVEVRGEIVCPKAALPRLGYKDCRTAAASLTNTMTASQDCKLLEFVAWQLDTTDGIGTESVSIELAADQGFKTSGCRGCWSDDVLTVLNEFEAQRDAYEYPTDGVVIKIDMKPVAASLGATEHHPKGNIAYKFSAQKAVTRCIGIEICVGETGRRTPRALLEPVMIMGREVKAASLGSERVWHELGVTEGCLVEVGLSNDVTPKIYRVIEEGHTESTESTDSFRHTALGEHCETLVTEGTQESAESTENAGYTSPAESVTTETVEPMKDVSDIEPANNQCVPVEEAPIEVPTDEPVCYNNDAEFERLQQENERLQAQIAQMQAQQCAERVAVTQQQTERPRPSRPRRHVQVRQQPQAVAVESENDRPWLKTAGYLAAASVALLLIWQTGLIIPLGLIGLATSGFLK